MSIITPEGQQQPTHNDFVRISGSPEELCPFMVLFQYAHGIFPWHEYQGKTLWWSPDPRCVLLLPDIKVSKSLRKQIRRPKFTVRADTNFEKVVRACANTRENTWITEQMIQVMLRLHKLGHAHSIETYNGPNLVGGFYGVAVGRIFFGESMFSAETDASKVALVRAVEKLGERGFPLIDCQLGSEHLVSMGARFIPRPIFTKVMVQFGGSGPRFVGPWTDFFDQ
jgi:leucyl/phenylalanyl-tRNA--protein transferase